MEKKAQELNGTHDIPFKDLFNPTFMHANTNFSNIDEFADQSNLDFSDMDNIDETELDNFVKANTSFESWDSMKSTAVGKWVAKQIGF